MHPALTGHRPLLHSLVAGSASRRLGRVQHDHLAAHTCRSGQFMSGEQSRTPVTDGFEGPFTCMALAFASASEGVSIVPADETMMAASCLRGACCQNVSRQLAQLPLQLRQRCPLPLQLRRQLLLGNRSLHREFRVFTAVMVMAGHGRHRRPGSRASWHQAEWPLAAAAAPLPETHSVRRNIIQVSAALTMFHS